jgi:hypothetical protein
VTEPTPDEPQRTRFVDPPPAEPERTVPVAEPPAELPVPPPPTVASAPVDTPPAAPEQTSAEEPPVASAPVDTPPAAPEQTSAEEPPVASAPVDTAYAAPQRTSGRGLYAAVAVLTAVCTVLVVLLVADVRGERNGDYEAKAKPALAAAKTAAKQVLSYDYRTLEPGFQKALALTTDVDKDCKAKADRTSKAYDPNARCFRTEFSLTHSKVVVDLATRYKAVVTADVGAAGVVGVAGDRVTVLLYVNQQSTNTQAANPKITQDRVEMLMQKVRGRWLVAGITAL